jgi:hypothetical protein
MPGEYTFALDPRRRTRTGYAQSEGQKDAARIRKSGKLSPEDRREVNAKLSFFEGEAREVYIREIKPTLLEIEAAERRDREGMLAYYTSTRQAIYDRKAAEEKRQEQFREKWARHPDEVLDKKIAQVREELKEKKDDPESLAPAKRLLERLEKERTRRRDIRRAQPVTGPETVSQAISMLEEAWRDAEKEDVPDVKRALELASHIEKWLNKTASSDKYERYFKDGWFRTQVAMQFVGRAKAEIYVTRMKLQIQGEGNWSRPTHLGGQWQLAIDSLKAAREYLEVMEKEKSLQETSLHGLQELTSRSLKYQAAGYAAVVAAPVVIGAAVKAAPLVGTEALTATGFRVAPRAMAWVARHPILATEIATVGVGTALQLAEDKYLDPVQLLFNFLHIYGVRLGTRPPKTPGSNASELDGTPVSVKPTPLTADPSDIAKDVDRAFKTLPAADPHSGATQDPTSQIRSGVMIGGEPQPTGQSRGGIPASKDPKAGPPKVLDVGAGTQKPDLGLPPKEHQLVAVTRSDVNSAAQPDVILDATQPIPQDMQGRYTTLIINNPYGYTANIGALQQALGPDGKIIVQGHWANRYFRELGKSPVPPNMTRTIERNLPPSAILGKGFRTTSGDSPVQPNARITFEVTKTGQRGQTPIVADPTPLGPTQPRTPPTVKPSPNTPKPAQTAQPGSKPPALSPEQQRQAQQTWEDALLPHAQQAPERTSTRITDKAIDRIVVAGVEFTSVQVTREGSELQIGYLRIDRRAEGTALPGSGLLVHEAFERAAIAVARRVNASTVRVYGRLAFDAAFLQKMKNRGYEPYEWKLGKVSREEVYAKLFTVRGETADAPTPAVPASPVAPAPPLPPRPAGGGGGPTPPQGNTIQASPPPMPGPAPVRQPPSPAPASLAPGRAEAVTESEVMASYHRDPSSIRRQGPGQHQDLWQTWGGAGQQAPLAYRDPDGVIRVNIEGWLSQPRPSIGVQLRPGAAAPPWASPPPTSRPAPTPANQALGVADTGQAPPPAQQPRAPSADPLAKTPAAPVPAPPPARQTPARNPRPGPPTAAASAASQQPMAARPPAGGMRMNPQLPPQAVSPDRVLAMAQSGAARIGYSADSERHRKAWELLGGRLNPGEDPPVAFLSEKNVYIDRSRWPSDRPLPGQ